MCDTITVGGARFISLWVVAVERATMAPRYSSTTQPPPLVNNRASLLTAWGKSVPTLKIQRAYTQLVLPDLVIYHQICKFVCPIFGYFEPNNWWYCDLGKYDLLGFNGGFSDMFSSCKQFFINGIRRFHLQYNKLNSLSTGSPHITLFLFFLKSSVKWNSCKVKHSIFSTQIIFF